MGRRSFSREFKLSAVKLVREQGYTVVEASKSLGIDGTSLRDWLKKLSPEASKRHEQ
jgi:transposase